MFLSSILKLLTNLIQNRNKIHKKPKNECQNEKTSIALIDSIKFGVDQNLRRKTTPGLYR